MVTLTLMVAEMAEAEVLAEGLLAVQEEQVVFLAAAVEAAVKALEQAA